MSIASLDFLHVFPRAICYLDRRNADPLCIKESPPSFPESEFTERHLHCAWYDPKWRPANLETHNGLPIKALHPGKWNLESGPDFLKAEIQVGAEYYKGDVEIHIRPNDWKQHHHSDDPNYQNVILHLTYHKGILEKGILPSKAFQASLQAGLKQNPYFSFEQIDLSAYPYEIEGPLTDLRRHMGELSPEEKTAFLDAAGEERLRQKTLRIKDAISRKGVNQALYEEVMVALGYKHNKVPFRVLAEKLSLTTLRKKSDLDPGKAYALLLGVSGLMPANPQDIAEEETAIFIRSLWDFWWKNSASWSLMDKAHWHFAHVRPTNHPTRRMMAAAYLFTEDDSLVEKIMPKPEDTPRTWRKRSMHMLEVNTQTYWTRRLALSEKTKHTPLALIGKPRAASILNNIFIPYLITSDHGFFKNLSNALPVETRQSDYPSNRSCSFRTRPHPQTLQYRFAKTGSDSDIS